MNEFVITGEQSGKRLDVFLSENWDQAESRSAAQRIIKAGEVSIDGVTISRVSVKLTEGQVVQANADGSIASKSIIASNIPLTIAYEDEHIAVVDKVVGMTAHPGSGHLDDTLANAAAYKWPHIVEIGEPDRPGIVHRLDKDTSGLMVIALTEPAYTRLSEMIRNHEITRIYSALVHGIPKSQIGVVDAPIGRSPFYRKRQAIDENGRPSRTHYKVDYVFGDFAFLEIRLETGRMHQIRVHMDAIGHPVIGDQTYGRQKNLPNLNRQFLHASKLEFDHPMTGERMSVTSELPSDLTRALEALQ
ncbi:MAG: RluA family pseudouridine synthase [Chloroflexi bacterium]|nr:RluA family pseudouridine synthase [Chloroflexota bacterium]MBT7003209.1 RluA family pseudouridine synthase [Chloroflexota bacterium]